MKRSDTHVGQKEERAANEGICMKENVQHVPWGLVQTFVSQRGGQRRWSLSVMFFNRTLGMKQWLEGRARQNSTSAPQHMGRAWRTGLGANVAVVREGGLGAEWGRRPGAEEPRSTRSARQTPPAKCRGHPKRLEQHISTLLHLKAVLSMLRYRMKMIFQVWRVVSFV